MLGSVVPNSELPNQSQSTEGSARETEAPSTASFLGYGQESCGARMVGTGRQESYRGSLSLYPALRASLGGWVRARLSLGGKSRHRREAAFTLETHWAFPNIRTTWTQAPPLARWVTLSATTTQHELQCPHLQHRGNDVGSAYVQGILLDVTYRNAWCKVDIGKKDNQGLWYYVKMKKKREIFRSDSDSSLETIQIIRKPWSEVLVD